MKLGGEVGAYQLTLKRGVTNAQHAPHPHTNPHPQTHTQRQPNIWINADIGVFSIGHLGTNFTEISITIYAFSLKKMHLKTSFGRRRPFCLGPRVLIHPPPKQDKFAAKLQTMIWSANFNGKWLISIHFPHWSLFYSVWLGKKPRWFRYSETCL